MNMKRFFKRYKMFILLLIVNITAGIAVPEFGASSIAITKTNLLEMLSVLPPIFILLGLLDVWVEKETMMRYLGKGSGVRGAVIAFILGAAAAGPLYGAFPVATVMLKKGSTLFNVFVFIGAWSTAKVPMFSFEASSLGLTFALTRLCMSVVGIVLIAVIVEKSLSKEEQAEVYELAEKA